MQSISGCKRALCASWVDGGLAGQSLAKAARGSVEVNSESTILRLYTGSLTKHNGVEGGFKVPQAGTGLVRRRLVWSTGFGLLLELQSCICTTPAGRMLVEIIISVWFTV